jgi:hypothetical protein
MLESAYYGEKNAAVGADADHTPRAFAPPCCGTQ